MPVVQKPAASCYESNIQFVNNLSNHCPLTSALPNYPCYLPPNVQWSCFNNRYNSYELNYQPVNYSQSVSVAAPTNASNHQFNSNLNQSGVNSTTLINFQNNQSDIFNTYFFNNDMVQKSIFENNNCITHQNPPSPYIPRHTFQQSTIPLVHPQNGVQHITYSQPMSLDEREKSLLLATEHNTLSSSEFKVSILWIKFCRLYNWYFFILLCLPLLFYLFIKTRWNPLHASQCNSSQAQPVFSFSSSFQHYRSLP